MTVYVGTSGWQYKHWLGRFYPRNPRVGDELAFYAECFQTVEANGSIQGTVEEVQSSADRIREAMELQAQTVTMITAAVDETALAADSMSSTIAAIRADTEGVAKEIDEVEQGFGRFSEQIANFKTTAKAFVSGIAA